MLDKELSVNRTKRYEMMIEAFLDILFESNTSMEEEIKTNNMVKDFYKQKKQLTDANKIHNTQSIFIQGIISAIYQKYKCDIDVKDLLLKMDKFRDGEFQKEVLQAKKYFEDKIACVNNKTYDEIVKENEKHYLSDDETFKTHEKKRAFFQVNCNLLKIMYCAWSNIQTESFSNSNISPLAEKKLFETMIETLGDYVEFKAVYKYKIAHAGNKKTDITKKELKDSEKDFETLIKKIKSFVVEFISSFAGTVFDSTTNDRSFTSKNLLLAYKNFLNVAKGYAGVTKFNIKECEHKIDKTGEEMVKEFARIFGFDQKKATKNSKLENFDEKVNADLSKISTRSNSSGLWQDHKPKTILRLKGENVRKVLPISQQRVSHIVSNNNNDNNPEREMFLKK